MIAGESHGVRSAVVTKTPTSYLDFRLARGESVQQVVLLCNFNIIHVLKVLMIGNPTGLDGVRVCS